jgi:biopolymer transport protein ExbB/TolQ
MVIATINDILNSLLYGISQSLLIPVLIVLLAFFVYAMVHLGILLSDYYYRRKIKFDTKYLIDLVLSLADCNGSEEITQIVKESKLSDSHKGVLTTIINSSKLGRESRESLARKMVEDEEILAAKKLEKTDIIAKIAPAIGLMGTLIPLGPGLAALGTGDIQTLSQHLIIAFGAAVIGMAAAAIGFTISKIKRRWYEEEISTLDTLAESILETL